MLRGAGLEEEEGAGFMKGRVASSSGEISYSSSGASTAGESVGRALAILCHYFLFRFQHFLVRFDGLIGRGYDIRKLVLIDQL